MQQVAEKIPKMWGTVAREAAKKGGMDRAVFVQLLDEFWAQLGRKSKPSETNKSMVVGWYVALCDLTEEQFVCACIAFLRTCGDQYPNPTTLRELSGVQTDKDAAALLAWRETLQAVRRVGAYQTPEFSDSVIPHVIEMFGGWIQFTETPSDELEKFVRPQFLRYYRSLCDQRLPPVSMVNLIDQQNSASGMTGLAAMIQARISEDVARRRQRALEHRSGQLKLFHDGELTDDNGSERAERCAGAVRSAGTCSAGDE